MESAAANSRPTGQAGGYGIPGSEPFAPFLNTLPAEIKIALDQIVRMAFEVLSKQAEESRRQAEEAQRASAQQPRGKEEIHIHIHRELPWYDRGWFSIYDWCYLRPPSPSFTQVVNNYFGSSQPEPAPSRSLAEGNEEQQDKDNRLFRVIMIGLGILITATAAFILGQTVGKLGKYDNDELFVKEFNGHVQTNQISGEQKQTLTKIASEAYRMVELQKQQAQRKAMILCAFLAGGIFMFSGGIGLANLVSTTKTADSSAMIFGSGLSLLAGLSACFQWGASATMDEQIARAARQVQDHGVLAFTRDAYPAHIF